MCSYHANLNFHSLWTECAYKCHLDCQYTRIILSFDYSSSVQRKCVSWTINWIHIESRLHFRSIHVWVLIHYMIIRVINWLIVECSLYFVVVLLHMFDLTLNGISMETVMCTLIDFTLTHQWYVQMNCHWIVIWFWLDSPSMYQFNHLCTHHTVFRIPTELEFNP